MKINFFNQNVVGARFKLCWGENNSTPAFILNPGDAALFDMDMFNQIPEGSDWWIQSYQGNDNVAKHLSGKYKYINGYGFSGTFKLARKKQDLELTFERAA